MDGAVASKSETSAGADALPPPPFVDVYTRELDYVWRTLWRLGVPERDLEDVSHDVFVVVHQKLHTFDAARPLRPWLFGIAFRVALDRRRKKSSGEVPVADAGVVDVDVDAKDAHAVVVAAEDRALVRDALLALPLEQRAVLVLHELDELPIPACAEVLQAPVATLYSRLRLARVAVKRFVTRVRP